MAAWRYLRELREPARQLRRHMTEPELRLWERLRRKQIKGVQFYRQRPVGRFIVDFYAPRARLIIEIDGEYHLEGEQAARDRERARWLEEAGFRVLRFTNSEVITRLEQVIAKVVAAVA